MLFLLEKRTSQWQPEKRKDAAVVFSPHYDDETLGAGGTIIKLRRSGVPVYLVFMTDGSRSHAHAIAGTTLSEMRRKEALKAAAILGVSDDYCNFLEFPETQLSQHRGEAVERVTEILRRVCCRRVFIPCRLEPSIWSQDHQITTAVVLEALRRINVTSEVIEYLVWCWYHWPWVPLKRGNDARQILRLTIQNACGIKSWLRVNSAVLINDVQTQKLEALDEYHTQMTRVLKTTLWPILADVGCGEFLMNFFGPHEYFRIYTYPVTQP
jgi:LmbE family N-acetylglucosaminyl deacetylase